MAGPIRVDYWAKPIPIRSFDYLAYRGDPEGLTGEGATEAEAIADLLAKEDEGCVPPIHDPNNCVGVEGGIAYSLEPRR